MLQFSLTANGEETSYCFLSDLLGKKLIAKSGRALGKCEDIIAALDIRYPEVVGLSLYLGGTRSTVTVDAATLVRLAQAKVAKLEQNTLPPLQLAERHFFVRDMLYDRQIVDVNGAKVERVNDVGIQIVEGHAHLVHVDVGFSGLLRRLGFERSLRPVARLLARPPKDRLIDWKFVQPLPEGFTRPIHISLRQEELKELHAGELADILEDLDRQERITLVQSIGAEEAADALEEADISVQTSIIRDLDTEFAADILEEMEPAVAADIIDELPAETQETLLAAMEEDDRAQIEVLVHAEEDSAASLMTVDFISCPEEFTVAQALAQIKAFADEVESITYVYCTDGEFHLTGVVSMRNLILAEPDMMLSEIMNRRLVTLKLDDDWNAVATQFLKLRFKALPVVDDEERLLGIVTFLHSFDELLPFYSKLKS